MGWLPGGKRARFYSINVMRARHPDWFRKDLEPAIRPRVAERISLEEVAEAHRRLEAAVWRGSSSCVRTSRRESAAVPPSC
jgi:NADPH:quinone reductase